MNAREKDPAVLLGIVGDMVVQASDRAGEALAHAADLGNPNEQALDDLHGINLALWRIRWELGLHGGAATAEGAAGGSEVMDILAARTEGAAAR